MKGALADKEFRCNIRIQKIYMLNNIPGMILDAICLTSVITECYSKRQGVKYFYYNFMCDS